jgi:hypothetical protein
VLILKDLACAKTVQKCGHFVPIAVKEWTGRKLQSSERPQIEKAADKPPQLERFRTLTC